MTSAARDDIPILASPAHLDEEAFGRLLDAHTRDAFNLAFRILRRREDAADAVQDAFVRALRAWRGERAAPREPARFRSWLLKIVSNVALDQIRSRARASVSPLGGLEDRLVAPRLRPDRAIERREERGAILHALLSLPASQRAALTLREYQGLTYDEIGQQLGTNHATTAMLLFRARVAFREAYQGLSKHAGPIGCPDLGPLLSAMVDGELDAAAWAGVDAHLETCGRCRRELRGLRQSKRLYAAIPLLAPPAGWSWAALAGASTAEAAALLSASSGAGIATTAGGLATTAAASIVPAATAPASLASASGLSGMLTAIGSLTAGKNALVATALAVTVAVGSPVLPAPPAMEKAAQTSPPAVSAVPSGDPAQRPSGMFATPGLPVIPAAGRANASDPPLPVVHGAEAGTATGGAARMPGPPAQAASSTQPAPPARAPSPLVAADAPDRAAASAARGGAAGTPSSSNRPADDQPGPLREPPGQDKEPPGQASPSTAQAHEPPGRDHEPPGQDTERPGRANEPPGQDEEPPGQAKLEAGPAHQPPGQAKNRARSGQRSAGAGAREVQAGTPAAPATERLSRARACSAGRSDGPERLTSARCGCPGAGRPAASPTRSVRGRASPTAAPAPAAATGGPEAGRAPAEAEHPAPAPAAGCAEAAVWWRTAGRETSTSPTRALEAELGVATPAQAA